jgi:hypothetical protein
LFVVLGGFMVYPRMVFTNDITPEMRRIPQRIFFFMACMDALGTFFLSMGQVYTPGQIQPLLNQVRHWALARRCEWCGTSSMVAIMPVHPCACLRRFSLVTNTYGRTSVVAAVEVVGEWVSECACVLQRVSE